MEEGTWRDIKLEAFFKSREKQKKVKKKQGVDTKI